ncbi:MAG: hypothetical protein NVV62_17295 [Terricaulis sp.]|nr:hypothetical protein [Terricaulis sp.]
MAKFSVLCRVDAFIDYVADVEASNGAEAAALAAENPDRIHWRRRGEAEFDARTFFTLDALGREIPESQRGDF